MGEIEGLMDEGTNKSCSICLDIVVDGGDRSTVRLQCGHDFHLDCIGSAFNAKGAMQCPNCRKVEKGNWLHSHGSRSLPELSFGWTYDDEDIYDLYSGMTFGVHWCPFSRLASLPSSYESYRLAAPPFLPSYQPHGHVHDQYGYQSGPTANLPPVGPAPSSLPDPTTYYLFPPPPPPPPPSSSHHHHHHHHQDYFQGTRDHFYSFPMVPVPLPHISTRAPSRGRAEGLSFRSPHSGRMRHYN